MNSKSLLNNSIKLGLIDDLINNKVTTRCIHTLNKVEVSVLANEIISKKSDTKLNYHSIYKKIVFFMDYFYRLNPQNKSYFISSDNIYCLLGEHYKLIINTLVEHKILDKERVMKNEKKEVYSSKASYFVDDYYLLYKFNDESLDKFSFRSYTYFNKCFSNTIQNQKFQEYLKSYIDKVTTLSEKYNEEDWCKKDILSKLKGWFPWYNCYHIPVFYIDQHNKSLAKTKLNITEKQIQDIEYAKSIKEGKDVNIRQLISNFNDKKYLKSIDKQLRVYSSLTSLPKEVRQYMNYSCSVDIHNSQPLLLTVLLREYYTYNKSIKRLINYFFNDKRTALDEYFEIGQNDWLLPNDVKLYIDLVNDSKKSEDKDFWSLLTEKMVNLKKNQYESTLSKVKSRNIENNWLKPNYSEIRSKVKECSFKDIFYSKENYKSDIKDVFNYYFPNVFSALIDMKKQIENYCMKNNKVSRNKKKECLSTLLMKIESILMITSLTELYYRTTDDYSFVSIHDAIYYIGSKETMINKYGRIIKVADMIKGVVREVYAAFFGLKPKFGKDVKSLYNFANDEKKVNDVTTPEILTEEQVREQVRSIINVKPRKDGSPNIYVSAPRFIMSRKRKKVNEKVNEVKPKERKQFEFKILSYTD